MNIHELTARRNELQKQLDEHRDMRSHQTYKLVERELKRIREQVKQHYRSEYKNGKQ